MILLPLKPLEFYPLLFTLKPGTKSPMEKINITYVLCNIGGYQQYVWIAEAIDTKVFQLTFIFLDESTNNLKSVLEQKGFTCYQLQVASKKDILKAIFQARNIFKKEKTTIVHTHLVNASLVGLLAAKLSGIKKRIHTRHHADFHHKYYKKGVLLDNLINLLSTDIVAVSKNVMNIVETKEKYHQHKITLIYHGLQLNDFDIIPEERITAIQQKYNIKKTPVIGMISRYEIGKGVEYAIAAFSKIIHDYPDAKLLIANAFGPEKNNIQKQLKDIPEHHIIEIEYEQDIQALYKCFDIFVHVPIAYNYEAFGQVYIEAMAASVPMVCTRSGVATEFIENGKNAVVVDYKNAEEIYGGIKKYLTDTVFTENIIQEARENVIMLFDLNKIISALNTLYLF